MFNLMKMLVDTQLIAFIPEISVTLASFFILLVGSLFKNRKSSFFFVAFHISICSLCVGIFSLLYIICKVEHGYMFFNKTFSLDCASIRIQLTILIFSILCLSFIYKSLQVNEVLAIEFFTLFLFSILGALIVVASHDFLILYVGLELMSLPLYTLVALNNYYKISYEAALKYFIMGCVSSALLLFGISLFYGISGLLSFDSAGAFTIANNEHAVSHGIIIFCPVMIAAGIAFKFGVAPFHMWVPDVYRGSTSYVITIIGTIPKIAVYGVIFRLLYYVFRFEVLLSMWVCMLYFMGMLSLIIGNFGALTQTNIKRLLGYSTIANMGFLFFGLIAGAELSKGDSYVSSFFYLLAYLFSFIGILYVVNILSIYSGKEVESIGSFKGLLQKSPFLAFVLLIFLFSLIGLPPLVGFYAKFFILLQLFYFGMGNTIVLILLFSVIGSYYYLKIIKEVFFKNVEISVKERLFFVKFDLQGKFFLSIIVIFVVFFGLFPMYLVEFCRIVMSYK